MLGCRNIYRFSKMGNLVLNGLKGYIFGNLFGPCTLKTVFVQCTFIYICIYDSFKCWLCDIFCVKSLYESLILSIDTVWTIKMFTSRRMTRSAWRGWWSWRWIWSTVSDKQLQTHIFQTKWKLMLRVRVGIGRIQDRPIRRNRILHDFNFSLYILEKFDSYR